MKPGPSVFHALTDGQRHISDTSGRFQTQWVAVLSHFRSSGEPTTRGDPSLSLTCCGFCRASLPDVNAIVYCRPWGLRRPRSQVLFQVSQDLQGFLLVGSCSVAEPRKLPVLLPLGSHRAGLPLPPCVLLAERLLCPHLPPGPGLHPTLRGLCITWSPGAPLLFHQLLVALAAFVSSSFFH